MLNHFQKIVIKRRYQKTSFCCQNAGLNLLIISTSHHRGGPLIGRFLSLVNVRVHHISVNFRSTQQMICFQYPAITYHFAITFFILFCYRITSLRMSLCNYNISIDLSIAVCVVPSLWFSFFVVANISSVYIITSKTVLLEKLVRRELPSFVLGTSFMMLSAFHSYLILRKISA